MSHYNKLEAISLNNFLSFCRKTLPPQAPKASSSDWADLVDKSDELDREAAQYRNRLRSYAERRARTESETTGVTVEPVGENFVHNK